MSKSTDRIGVDEIPLECWPLVHGSLRLAQTKDAIRRDGLRPPAQGGKERSIHLAWMYRSGERIMCFLPRHE